MIQTQHKNARISTKIPYVESEPYWGALQSIPLNHLVWLVYGEILQIVPTVVVQKHYKRLLAIHKYS